MDVVTENTFFLFDFVTFKSFHDTNFLPKTIGQWELGPLSHTLKFATGLFLVANESGKLRKFRGNVMEFAGDFVISM